MIAFIVASLLILSITDCDAKRSAKATPRGRRDALPHALDPHGEFCVDVSTYSDVIMNRTTPDKCVTTFTKECKDITERVRTSLYTILYQKVGGRVHVVEHQT